MATHDIARETWAAYFNDLTRSHQGALVTIEAVSPTDGRRNTVQDVPFGGISLERDGTVLIETTTDSDARLNHSVSGVTAVYHKDAPGVMSLEETRDEVLELVSEGGDPPITYLHFRHRPGDEPVLHENPLES